MYQEIALYIGNERVEFDVDPSILYTYQLNDLQNPTAVKNSFSKTITVKGTQNNNRIFGEYWNLERIEGDGRNGNGVAFNSSKKVDFNLYVNSELYESGYAKLDNVRKTGNDIIYSITLYGGLGEFFYNLSTNDNTGEQLKLSDLDFLTKGGADELDFTINMDTVKTAWDNIDNPNSELWNTINFMPSYNGLPEDFDADKCVINLLGGTELPKTWYDSETRDFYGSKAGFVIADLPKELTEHEMRDYRSYLMRPVIRMRKIIEACCDQRNNGGYTVELDSDFFNNSNPYWTDTWLTLPMISNLELDNTNQIMTGATLTASTTTGDEVDYMYEDIHFTLGNFPEEMDSLTVAGTISTDCYDHFSSFMLFLGKKSDRSWDKWDCFGSLFCQLLAYNGDTVVGASQTYNLTTPIWHHNKLYYGHNDRYSGEGKYYPHNYNNTITDVIGYFHRDGFRYYDWETDTVGEPRTFIFTITNLTSQVTSLKMRYFWGASEKMMKRYKKSIPGNGKAGLFGKTYDINSILPFDSWDVGRQGLYANALRFNVTYKSINAIVGDSLGRTGTDIKKSYLLNTEASPCDYLLSYCKQFGLYFTKDVEDKKIYIETRKTFYDRSQIFDLEKLIDRSKDMSITPLTFNTKWLQFNPQNEDTAFAGKYKLAEGYDYGVKLVNTGYDFSSDKTDILKDIVIKGGIEGHEKSKYFTSFQKDYTLRPWMVGMKYNLYSGEKTHEVTPPIIAGKIYGINEGKGMKYYDLFPKVQFHDDDNSGVDGNNVLVFFSGFKKVNTDRAYNIRYILSDDNKYMTDLNDGAPCWLFTHVDEIGDERLCYSLYELPVFERYRTIDGSNTITSSLDFGAPRQLYAQGYSYDNAITIYDTYWKSYIEDLYDVNTKILTCYVLLDERPNPTWLRRFYWFDNSIWRLNKITDWNVASVQPTKMEFVKVQDLRSYTSNDSKPVSIFSLKLDKHNIPPEGGVINATVVADDGVEWHLYYTDGIYPSVTSGVGTTTFTITVPPRSDNQEHQYTVTARGDISATVTILQDTEGEITVEESEQTVDYNIPSTGGTVILTVKSKYPWMLEPNFDITASKTSGQGGEETVLITFPESLTMAQKRVTLTFKDEYGKTATWTKYQDKLNEIRFPAAGESKTIEVGYTGAVFNTPDWITVVDNGDGTYTFTAAPNDGDERQNGIIGSYELPATKAEDGKTVTISIKAIQDAHGVTPTRVFKVYPSVADYGVNGGSRYVSLTYTHRDGDTVTAQVSGTGFSVGEIVWTGDTALVEITAAANPDENFRTGYVVFSSAVGTVKVSLTQDGNTPTPPSVHYLNTVPSRIDFKYIGGSEIIKVSSDLNWNVETTDD